MHGLNLPSGIWCNDDNILKDEAVNYFKVLLSRDGEVRVGSHGEYRTCLSDDARRVLTKPVFKIEVYEALMSMKSYKAQDLMGFNLFSSKCFGRMWEMIFGVSLRMFLRWDPMMLPQLKL